MIKKLFKNSFIFVFGDVLNKAVPFLMLPILTRYLTPSDYGVIATFSALLSLLAVFTGLNIHGAINVNFFTMSKEKLKVFIGNCIIILNISTIFVFIIVYISSPLLIEKLSLNIEWLLTAVILAFAQFLTTINLLLWTAEKNPKSYGIYQISQTLTVTLLSLTMVVGFGMNWEGQLIATTIGVLIFSIVSFVFMYKRGYLLFKPNKIDIIDALKFGIPLIPHTLSTWLKTAADKMILVSILGTSVVGIYTVGYQLGFIISVLTIAFNKAWVPYLFETLSHNPSILEKKKIVIFTYIYFISILIFVILFNYIAKLLIPYFLGKDFVNAYEFMKYFSFAFAFQGMYLMVTNYIFYMKKTHILSYITFTTSILHIALLYLFINIYGASGAAKVSVITFFITFILVWIYSHKVYPMPWKVWKIKNQNYEHEETK